jgi:hypothetical protein
MKLRKTIDRTAVLSALALLTLAPTQVGAAGLAEAFKDLDAEVRASIVKELIRSRAYDLEHTQKRPKNKASSGVDEKIKTPNAQDSADQVGAGMNSATGGLTSVRPRDGGDANLDRLKDSFEDDDYERPVRDKVCSMEIASQKKEPGKPTPRRQTIVITDPIIQICK